MQQPDEEATADRHACMAHMLTMSPVAWCEHHNVSIVISHAYNLAGPEWPRAFDVSSMHCFPGQFQTSTRRGMSHALEGGRQNVAAGYKEAEVRGGGRSRAGP